MFETIKLEIIKNTRNNHWPKQIVEEHNRYSTLKTALIILIAISTNQFMTIQELCKLTNRSPKTIRRILAVLDEVGVPIYTEILSDHRLIYRVHKSFLKQLKLY